MFSTPSANRNGILANAKVKQGLAVVVEHNGAKYVVDTNGQILSVATKKIMQWGTENGDRNAVLQAAQQKFNDKPLLTQALVQLAQAAQSPIHFVVDMEDYLKQHNLDKVLQAIRKRRIFNSDLQKSEIKAIHDYIQSLPQDTDTSNGLHLIRNGYLYTFNTSLAQFSDNIRDGHNGFEITGKYDVRKLNKDELNEIEQDFSNGTSLDAIIRRTGITPAIPRGSDRLYTIKN